VPLVVFDLHFKPDANKSPIQTFGRMLLDEKLPYSNYFKETLLTCLAWDPDERPTARQLLQSCMKALATIKNYQGETPRSIYDYDPNAMSWNLGAQPKENLPHVNPPYPRDTALGPGPEVDIFQGLSDPTATENWTVPVWPVIPPTPV
jgi:hypothetical protein